MKKTQITKPFSHKTIIRFLSILVIILSLTAGYYQVRYELEVKKYKRLEDFYVRVRNHLGREETQRIIDLSYTENSIK